MKATFVALALAASALAQGVNILAPTAGTTMQRGATFDVVVQTQNSLIGSDNNIALAIGVEPCGASGCDALPQETIGSVILTGEYMPTVDAAGNVTQSFNILTPSNFAVGPARLSVAMFTIVGATDTPMVNVTHTTLNITA